MQNFRQMQSSITDIACKTLVDELVTSRVNYANCSLDDSPQVTLPRLLRMKNCIPTRLTHAKVRIRHCSTSTGYISVYADIQTPGDCVFFHA